MEPDPILAGVLREIHASGAPPMHSVSPDRARNAYRRMTEGPRTAARTLPVDTADQWIDSPAGPLRLRVHRPRNGRPDATCLYLHGGGYVIGDLDTHEATATTLAHEMGAVVVGVDYRLAPENPFPAAHDDSRYALDWVWRERCGLGGNDRILLAGDSAGAALCLSLCATPHGVPIVAQLLLCPYLDLIPLTRSRRTLATGFLLEEATLSWFATLYSGEIPIDEVAMDPRVRPTADAALRRAPASVVAVAGFDPLRDEGVALVPQLLAAGIRSHLLELPDMVHGFPDFVDRSPRAEESLAEVIRAFRAFVKAEDHRED